MLKRSGPGKYDLVESIAGFVADQRKQVSDQLGSGREPQSKLTSAKAEILELDLAEKRGELIKVKMVDPIISRLAAMTKARLLAVPSAVVPRLATTKNAVEAEKLIEDAIRDALDELSRVPDFGENKASNGSEPSEAGGEDGDTE